MGEFTATDAARTLSELEDAEELLSQRTGGITTMVWGIISAAIFLAYGVVETILEVQWVFAVVWVPFVVAGAIVTKHMWRQNAVVLGRPETAGVKGTAITTLGFLGLGAILFVGSRAMGIAWDMDGIMTTVNGLMAGIIGVLLRRHGARGWSHLIGAATAMIIGGILLGIGDLRVGVDVLAAAGICGFSWFLAGFAMHQQG